MGKNIIRDFDRFKRINESGDMTLLGFLGSQVGPQIEKVIKQRVLSMVLEYMGIPADDPNSPEGKGQWIREIFVKTMSEVSLDEMDEILKGTRLLNDSKFWVPKIAKSLKAQIIDSGTPSASGINSLLGISNEGFLGRLITNSFREFILDERNLERMLVAAWRLLAKEEFIPRKDSDEIYKEAYNRLTPEQQKKVPGSVWKASMSQQDWLRRKSS